MKFLREFGQSVIIGFHLSVQTIQVNFSPAELPCDVIQITVINRDSTDHRSPRTEN